MPKAKFAPPPAKMKPIVINPQTGPFEKLIEQTQDACDAKNDGPDPTCNQAKIVDKGKKDAAQKKKQSKPRMPPPDRLDYQNLSIASPTAHLSFAIEEEKALKTDGEWEKEWYPGYSKPWLEK